MSFHCAVSAVKLTLFKHYGDAERQLMSGTVPKLINPPKSRVLGGAMWRHLSGPVGKQPRSSRVDAEPELIIPAGLRLSLCRMTGCPCIAFPAHPVGPTLTGLSAV